MTTLMLQAAPFVEVVASKLQVSYLRFLHALDVFAENRMRKAVPEAAPGQGGTAGVENSQPMEPVLAKSAYRTTNDQTECAPSHL